MKNILKMNQHTFKFFLIGFVLLTANNIYSQNNLNESEQKKVSVAEKKINKAEIIVKKADGYISQIEVLKNDGRVRTRKILKLETKANNIIIKSSSYYKDGYGKKYSTYSKAVQRHLKDGSLQNNFETNKVDAHKTYKTGRKWRRKSNSQGNVDKGVEFLLKANEVEGTAIESLVDILNHVGDNNQYQETTSESVEDTSSMVSDVLSAEPEPQAITEIPQDSILATSADTLNTEEALQVNPVPSDSVYTAPIVQEALAVSSEDAIAAVTPAIEEAAQVAEPAIEKITETAQAENLATYFTIQFLADKQPVPKEKLSSMYNGPLEINKHEADGWFRYSIGKFTDINKAKEALQTSGVNGYIVAYNNNNRISTREAIEILKSK